jgi:YidC/Oxa1 family membrane protein insertase
VLNWLYTAISWILLRWHDVWSFLEGQEFLNTNWDWILAIIFLVITIRLILFPLFVKQIKSQRAMQALQPKLKELQEKHKGDRETLQKEMMELYQKEKVNPLMGCLPILLQIPVFISLFWILRRLDPQRPAAVRAGEATLEGSKTTLYTWTFEQFESASLAQLFGGATAARFFDENFGRFAELGASLTTTRIVLGVLVLLMMATTFLTARQMVLKTGWATDPTQLMMQRLMVYGFPAMLLFSGLFFPLGVILYWVVQNVISLLQQQWVLRKYPPPAMATATAGGSGRGGTAAKGKSDGKGKPGKDGKTGAAPAIDGKKLAPKPGAKPVHPKKGPAKRVPPSANIPPKPKANVPPKRKSGSPRKS